MGQIMTHLSAASGGALERSEDTGARAELQTAGYAGSSTAMEEPLQQDELDADCFWDAQDCASEDACAQTSNSSHGSTALASLPKLCKYGKKCSRREKGCKFRHDLKWVPKRDELPVILPRTKAEVHSKGKGKGKNDAAIKLAERKAVFRRDAEAARAAERSSKLAKKRPWDGDDTAGPVTKSAKVEKHVPYLEQASIRSRSSDPNLSEYVYALDGLNILRHRNHPQANQTPPPDWEQLRMAAKYYRDYKYKVVVFLRRDRVWHSSEVELHGLRKLLGSEHVVACPAGASDDSFMLQYTEDLESSSSGQSWVRIVSNDQFRDFANRWGQPWIDRHTVKYAFAAGSFVPEDAWR